MKSSNILLIKNCSYPSSYKNKVVLKRQNNNSCYAFANSSIFNDIANIQYKLQRQMNEITFVKELLPFSFTNAESSLNMLHLLLDSLPLDDQFTFYVDSCNNTIQHIHTVVENLASAETKMLRLEESLAGKRETFQSELDKLFSSTGQPHYDYLNSLVRKLNAMDVYILETYECWGACCEELANRVSALQLLNEMTANFKEAVDNCLDRFEMDLQESMTDNGACED